MHKRRPTGLPSDTESEQELPIISQSMKAGTHRAAGQTDSIVNDTDSEEEVEVRPVATTGSVRGTLRLRPAFPPGPEQEKKPAFLLDASLRIQVPRSISMFLRPYQEEGVSFFWKRFKDGRGGILGKHAVTHCLAYLRLLIRGRHGAVRDFVYHKGMPSLT
jgi:hypothetical protein